MTRLPVVLGCALAITLATELPAQRPQARSGFWYAFGLGTGWARVACQICRADHRPGVSAQLRLGGGLSRSVLIGAELAAWDRSANGVDETLAALSAAAYWYPARRSPLYLKGGLGFSTHRAEDGTNVITSTGQARQPHSSPAVRSALLFLYDHLQDPKVQPPAGVRLPLADMRVLDSIHADGAKLIEMCPEAASVLRASYPGLRIVPVVYFYPAVAPRQGIAAVRAKTTKRVAGKLTVQVLSGSGDGPVTGATVVAFTDFASRAGAAGTTDANGRVSLALGASSKKIDRLYIYAQRGFWGLLKRSFTLTNGMTFTLRAIDLSYVDELRYIYPNIPATAGGGVSVGVIDTGIADHPDLTIAGGRNTVVGEAPSDYGDNGEGHGTHVAGIIAAHGTPPKGVRGAGQLPGVGSVVDRRLRARPQGHVSRRCGRKRGCDGSLRHLRPRLLHHVVLQCRP